MEIQLNICLVYFHDYEVFNPYYFKIIYEKYKVMLLEHFWVMTKLNLP